MRFIVSIIFLVLAHHLPGQVKILGYVLDENSEPILGANVYLAETYDGGSSDIDGNYQFLTEEQGRQRLIATSIGFKKLEKEIFVNGKDLRIDITLEEDVSVIDEVVITAGSFEASDTKKAVVLRPFDIVTTAGATADIAGVMNNLPGTQTVAEDGKLYVRGGDNREIKAFIDGMLVSEPFDATPSNIPSRFRFSPFLFNGTFFSTGGYSAEYGNAMSSVLVLETSDLPVRSQTDISLMSVGADINQTVRWKNSSLYTQLQYTDLGLYFKLVPQNYEWKTAPKGISGIVHYKNELKNGLVKFYSNYQHSAMRVSQPFFPDITKNERVDINNDYFYNNLAINYRIKEKVSLKGGLSGSYWENQSDVGQIGRYDNEWSFHSKLVSDFTLHEKVFLKAGFENFSNKYHQRLFDSQYTSDLGSGFSNNLTSGFAEMDIYLPFKVVIRPGVRIEHASLIDKNNVAPRFSLAYKISEHGQFSAAAGRFYQLPEKEYLLLSGDINYELAEHYLVNYQYEKGGYLFRTEAFFKNYHNLIKYRELGYNELADISNQGEGKAKGIDVFWRDRSTLKNGDYWVSYSFVDTKREYKNYDDLYAPPYASTHNFSLVYKQFFQVIRSQIGMTYHFSSPRTYDDPNTEEFLDKKTKPYHDVSANLSFLLKPSVVIHFSVSNLLGIDQRFGRQYSVLPNDEGFYDSIPIKSQAKRFLFLGCFITFSKDKNANQLNNL